MCYFITRGYIAVVISLITKKYRIKHQGACVD